MLPKKGDFADAPIRKPVVSTSKFNAKAGIYSNCFLCVMSVNLLRVQVHKDVF